MPGHFIEMKFPPIRGVVVEISDRGIKHLSLVSDRSLKNHPVSYSRSRDFGRPRYATINLFCQVERQLAEYFAGERKRFNLPLDFAEGSLFQTRVWNVLQDIPYGEVTTYAEIAGKVGVPRAARAVGNACAKNLLPLLVPCHRVIKSDGSIGGYTGGIDIKKFLLQLEKGL